MSVSHCVKSVQIRIFSDPYFSAFGLNTEIYSVNLRIQSQCGKIRARKKSLFGHFSCSVALNLTQLLSASLTYRWSLILIKILILIDINVYSSTLNSRILFEFQFEFGNGGPVLSAKDNNGSKR